MFVVFLIIKAVYAIHIFNIPPYESQSIAIEACINGTTKWLIDYYSSTS